MIFWKKPEKKPTKTNFSPLLTVLKNFRTFLKLLGASEESELSNTK